MDTLTPKKRSENMARVRSSNTVPELRVRRLLHAAGYRFRLHRKNLPGTPDIVLPAYRTAVLVHGCFWHRHVGCRDASTPKTRMDFWQEKFRDNIARDSHNLGALQELGWRVIVVWECELRDESLLLSRLNAALHRKSR